MPKIILENEQLDLEIVKRKIVRTGFISEDDILKKRSKKYLDLIAGLDTQSLKETKGMENLMIAIQEEFGALGLINLPLGIVSKCFLGHPYEVHTLDLCGSQIVKHYKVNEKMDSDFERARTLAKHNSYAMVEVYKDKIILIHADGNATKL